MTILEQSEVQVLDYLKLTKIPAISDKEWLKAVVLVQKHDHSVNYAVAAKKDGDVSIIKDFGNISGIAEIVEIRPYEFTKSEDNEGTKKTTRGKKKA